MAEQSEYYYFLKELFPGAGPELVRLLHGAADNAFLLRSDFYTIRDWVERAGNCAEGTLHATLLLMLVALEEGSLCIEVSAAALLRRLQDFVPEPEARAWAERKAAPFEITPLHCGADSIPDDQGFATTAVFGVSEPESGSADKAKGITLASAIAISGAAVSPNMGYYSAPSTAFLMTLFNLRLGAWFRNPAQAHDAAELGRPVNALWAYISELSGQSDNKSKASRQSNRTANRARLRRMRSARHDPALRRRR